MKITDFSVMNSNGENVLSDPFGNNVAFTCKACGHPVLAIAIRNQRGGDKEHPSECRGCSAKYFLELHRDAKQVYVRQLER